VTPRLALTLAAALLLACGGPGSSADGGTDAGPSSDAGALHDAGQADAGAPDAGALDAGPPDAGRPDAGTADAGRLVTLPTDAREFRGVWVATVSNLDFALPASPDAGRLELEQLVAQAADAGFNALLFQVRPESDALYDSALEPWSRTLTGTQGQNPGWDPLATLLTLAHAQGLEVHAWVNPYRAAVSATGQLAPTSIARTLASAAITYNSQLVMDPGVPAVRQHVLDVMSDLLGHYDVDGLHFDDYFYPYPDAANSPFPDDATWAAHPTVAADGGVMNKGDWRRNNVNQLIEGVAALVSQDHPQVRFGISPFGIYRPGTPAGVTGLDAYQTLACDAPLWLRQGWVDYLAPQLYWTTTTSGHDYDTLSTWWASQLTQGRHLFPGHAINKMGTTGWDVAELRRQFTQTRSLASLGARGDISFRAQSVFSNAGGARALLHDELYATPALTPAVPRVTGVAAPPLPFVQRGTGAIDVTHPAPALLRFLALYEQTSTGWVLRRVSGEAQAHWVVTTGTWAVSAVARGGAESQGVVLDMQ
jgi:uncharacterized lipoprotein YddW (UPF0748 family)